MTGERKVRKIIRRSDKTVVVSNAQSTMGLDANIPIDKNAKLKVIPLGGMRELGKNTWVLEYNDEIYIIDIGMGLSNDGEEESKVEYPDLGYLVKNKNKIKGLFLTHAHEEHMGGVLQLLQYISVPEVYGPQFALSILEEKINEQGLQRKFASNKIRPRQTFKLGSFSFTYVRNTHSINDSYSIIINTPVGKILYTGDFKLDYTPIDKEFFDLYTIAKAGEEGIHLLIGNSKNSLKNGFAKSERHVHSFLDKAFQKARGKIIFSTFTSHFYRIKQVLTISQELGKKVVVSDRALLKTIKLAKQLGYLVFPDNLIVDITEIKNIKENNIVLLSTDSQGESLSALKRLAYDEFGGLQVEKTDTVIISESPLPGNERVFADVINAFSAKGVKLIYGAGENIFVSGHACEDELRFFLSIVKPKYFIPCQGEFGMLSRHKKFAIESGVDPKNIFILNNGDVLETTTVSAKVSGTVAVKQKENVAAGNSELDEVELQRQKLSSQGLFSLMATIKNGKIVSEPTVDTKGLILGQDELKRFSTDVSKQALEVLNKNLKTDGKDLSALQEKVKTELKRSIQKDFKVNPLMQVLLLES